jgi:hypothetical protein
MTNLETTGLASSSYEWGGWGSSEALRRSVSIKRVHPISTLDSESPEICRTWTSTIMTMIKITITI